MSAVGFEPTRSKTLRPERNPLDHSGKLTARGLSKTHSRTHPLAHLLATHGSTHTATATRLYTTSAILVYELTLARHSRTLSQRATDTPQRDHTISALFHCTVSLLLLHMMHRWGCTLSDQLHAQNSLCYACSQATVTSCTPRANGFTLGATNITSMCVRSTCIHIDRL